MYIADRFSVLYKVPLGRAKAYTPPPNKAINKPISAQDPRRQVQTYILQPKPQLKHLNTEPKKAYPSVAKYPVQRTLRWDPREDSFKIHHPLRPHRRWWTLGMDATEKKKVGTEICLI